MDKETIDNMVKYWEREVEHQEQMASNAYHDRDETNLRCEHYKGTIAFLWRRLKQQDRHVEHLESALKDIRPETKGHDNG